MALKEQISELVTPAVVGAGFYLEDVEILNAGRSRVITCIVDGDIPLNLDQVTVVTKAISALLDTVKSEEQLSLSHNDQLYLLFHEEDVRLFEPQDMQFFCSCSRQRTESALINLGVTEMREIIAEQGLVLITCQFCDEEYRFDESHIEALFNSPQATLH